MRKMMYFAASLAALAAVFAACNKEQEMTPRADLNPAVIRVTIPDALTKVSFTEITEGGSGLALAWQDNDAIRVIGQTSELFSISEGFSGHEAEFTGNPVTGNTYTILYPGTYESKEALGARDYSSQTQNGNGSTAHLVYNAMLSGVDTYQDVAFKSDWASAHGGNFVQNGVLKLVVKLPDGVTTLKKVSLKADDEVFCLDNMGNALSDELALDLENVDVSSASQVLTAYMDISAAEMPVDAGSTLTVTVIGSDDTEYIKEFTLKNDVVFQGGQLNTIRLSAEEESVEIFSDYYVTVSGAGVKNGQDWDNALGLAELRKLLKFPAAIDGAKIHMAKGDYYLAEGATDNQIAMAYPDYGKQVAVSFLGGYPDNLSGNALTPRDTVANRTAFTGKDEVKILNLGDNTDVTFEGLTFKNSNAGGVDKFGALVVNGNNAKVKVTYCRFVDNANGDKTGAAIVLGKCAEALIEHCYFSGNTCRNASSVHLYDASAGTINLNNSYFTANETTNTSGCIQNAGPKNFVVTACTFESNKAKVWGGVFHTGSNAVTTFNNCVFKGNSAQVAGVISLQGAKVICTNCLFSGNSCTKYGGSGTNANVGGGVAVLRNEGDELTLNGCTFNENKTDGYGGVISTVNKITVKASDCVFYKNVASSGWGGAINLHNAGSRLYLDNCLFKENSQSSRGAIGADKGGCLMYLNRVVFKDNTNVNNNAWGVAIQSGTSVVCMNNVTTMGNHSTNATPGNTCVFNADSGWLITNSTLVDDPATALVRDNGQVKTTVCNNIFINRTTANNVFVMGKGADYFDDCGHNLLSCDGTYNNAAPVATDLLGQTDAGLGGSYTELWNSSGKYGVYSWDGSLTGFTAATRTDVENAIKGYNVDYSANVTGITHVGNDYYNWLVSLGETTLGVDGRGVTRGTPWWPGAYQN